MSQLMAGFVTSADTGNEDLVITSRAALVQFCLESETNLTLIGNTLLHNLKTYQADDRVLVPTLEIVAFLFNTGLLPGSADMNLKSLCLQTQKAGYKTGNIRKLLACVKVYSGVAATNASLKAPQESGILEARKRLGALMLHPWPRVRSAVIDELWGLSGDDNDILTGVDWGKAEKGEIKDMVQTLQFV